MDSKLIIRDIRDGLVLLVVAQLLHLGAAFLIEFDLSLIYRLHTVALGVIVHVTASALTVLGLSSLWMGIRAAVKPEVAK
ncbi:hypothetical protein ACFODL_15410 [Phenylobacterium terrae]|uniref:Uncharacterized protein n=1 Tax=Phenylobacterium terrae TaxID=2665495 RepID=A0ABW4N7U1_9CAUL